MSRWSSVSAVVVGSAALAFPFMVNAYWLSVGVLAMFYAIVAASWALLAGYAGQFSFGHMAFVSLGAYTSGLLVMTFGVPIPLRHGCWCDDVRHRRQWHRLRLSADARSLPCVVHSSILRGTAHCDRVGERGHWWLRRTGSRRPCSTGAPTLRSIIWDLLLLVASLGGSCSPGDVALGAVLSCDPRERGRSGGGRRQGGAVPHPCLCDLRRVSRDSLAVSMVTTSAS